MITTKMVERYSSLHNAASDMQGKAHALARAIGDGPVSDMDKASSILEAAAEYASKPKSTERAELKAQSAVLRAEQMRVRWKMHLLRIEDGVNELVTQMAELKAHDAMSHVLDACPQ